MSSTPLTVDPDRVRKAAADCPTAAATLKTLFQEAFERSPLTAANGLITSLHGRFYLYFTDGTSMKCISLTTGSIVSKYVDADEARVGILGNTVMIQVVPIGERGR